MIMVVHDELVFEAHKDDLKGRGDPRTDGEKIRYGLAGRSR